MQFKTVAFAIAHALVQDRPLLRATGHATAMRAMSRYRDDATALRIAFAIASDAVQDRCL
jgi:hypothetical protein